MKNWTARLDSSLLLTLAHSLKMKKTLNFTPRTKMFPRQEISSFTLAANNSSFKVTEFLHDKDHFSVSLSNGSHISSQFDI